MTRSEAVAIIVRRLNLNAGRVAALAQRVAEAGLLPKANGRDVPDLGPLDLARLLLAALCDRGLGNAAASVRDFEALQTDNGVVLFDVLEGLISGRADVAAVRSMVIHLQPASVTILSRVHLRFGAEQSEEAAAKTVVVPGSQLAAIGLEFRGVTAEKADEVVAVGRLAAALN